MVKKTLIDEVSIEPSPTSSSLPTDAKTPTKTPTPPTSPTPVETPPPQNIPASPTSSAPPTTTTPVSTRRSSHLSDIPTSPYSIAPPTASTPPSKSGHVNDIEVLASKLAKEKVVIGSGVDQLTRIQIVSITAQNKELIAQKKLLEDMLSKGKGKGKAVVADSETVEDSSSDGDSDGSFGIKKLGKSLARKRTAKEADVTSKDEGADGSCVVVDKGLVDEQTESDS